MLCLYLIYTLFQTLYEIRLAGDFYTLLGVSTHASEREIKARFRRLAAKFHPDKLRDAGSDTRVNDVAFVRLKLAQDTLLEPAKRFAYDRFGPAIVHVQHPGLKTIRDYVYAGLRGLIPEYAKGAASLALLNYFWLPSWGQYWRYLAIATLVFLELFFLTHQWETPRSLVYVTALAHRFLPDLLPPHLLPFQILSLARRMSLSLNIFISQLTPPSAKSAEAREVQTNQQIAHLSHTASRLEAETTGLLDLGLAPFKGDSELSRRLRRGMKDGIVMGEVRNHPEVRAAVERVIERRNRSAGLQDPG